MPAYDWRSPEYDDSAWKIGRAPLGHTNDRERQAYVQTSLEAAKSPTYYFRKSFELDSDPGDLSGLYLNIAYEDGYVVYLNGQEVSRDSIRTGLLTRSSLAYANEFSFYRRIDLKAHLNKLVKGTNIIAVEMHRSHPGSPNLFFDFALSIESKERNVDDADRPDELHKKTGVEKRCIIIADRLPCRFHGRMWRPRLQQSRFRLPTSPLRKIV